MRICIVGSCGKKKLSSHPRSPTCNEIQTKGDIRRWQEEFKDLCHPARVMYTGNQNRELVKGLDLLRTIDDAIIDFYIISAGFGFLRENDLVPPYDCAFSGMKKRELQERAENLGIPHDFEEHCLEQYDLMYLALGKDYFLSLGTDWIEKESTTVIQFVMRDSPTNHVWFPADNRIVQTFSANGHKVHGAAGFKGDLLRIMAGYALRASDPYGELIEWTSPSYLKQLFADLYVRSQSTLGC